MLLSPSNTCEQLLQKSSEKIWGELNAVTEKRSLINRWDSPEQGPLVVVLLNIYADMKDAWQ